MVPFAGMWLGIEPDGHTLMKCPICNEDCGALVKETRRNIEGETIRRRACVNTGKSFYTREVPDLKIVLKLDKVKVKTCKAPDIFNVWK